MSKVTGDTPTLSDVIRAGVQEGAMKTWTALVCKVKSYDEATQCADAEPVTKAFDAAGNVQDLPAITCMPVAFPAGGGYSVTWKIEPGDNCLVVFNSIAMSQYISSGEEGAVPEAPRRNSMSDGVVIPGVRSFKSPLASAADPDVEFSAGADDGSVGMQINVAQELTLEAPVLIKGGAGAADFVALAALVLAELAKIKIALDTHIHPGVTPGPASTGPAPPVYIPASVAASKFMAE